MVNHSHHLQWRTPAGVSCVAHPCQSIRAVLRTGRELPLAGFSPLRSRHPCPRPPSRGPTSWRTHCDPSTLVISRPSECW